MRTKKRRFAGKTINIAGIDYTIKYVKQIEPRNRDFEAVARVDFEKRHILILDNLSPSEEVAYLIHEICHATLEALLPPTLLAGREEIEELFIGPFARILTGAMRSAGLLKN